MKKIGLFAAAALLLLSVQLAPQAVQARSLGRMLQSAENRLSGRDAYFNQFRYGYGSGMYNNPYVNPYYSNYYNSNVNPYVNPYAGYSPYGYGWY